MWSQVQGEIERLVFIARRQKHSDRSTKRAPVRPIYNPNNSSPYRKRQ